MPSLDKTTLILQTRKELIETGTTSGQWDDTELASFLQEANEAITEIAEVEALPVTVPTVAAQETISFPASLSKIKGIWSRRSGTNNPWVKMRKAELDERNPDSTNAQRGQPKAYLIYGALIYLLPIPDTVYDLNCMGYSAASDLVGGGGATVPIFDAKFHSLLKLYAVARAKQKMDDPGYQNYDGQYTAGITGMRVWKIAQKEQEGPAMPKLASGMWE